MKRPPVPEITAEFRLAIGLLSTYLFFLSRRPVSSSNVHYLARRIAGLRSLAGLVEAGGNEAVERIATRLRSLNAANFSILNRSLQFELALNQPTSAIPPHYIVGDRALGSAFFQGVSRVLLLLGPAIGVGDEIILFPLPAWLKSSFPDVEVTVMSGYVGLWDRVEGPDAVHNYVNLEEILQAIRGHHSMGRFDLVIMADFEKPGLVPVLSLDREVERYIEISLGAECVHAIDHRHSRIDSMRMPLDSPIPYYEAMERLTSWMGIKVPRHDRYNGLILRTPRVSSRPFRIFVSPFTSKYDPSAFYWSMLLASIYPTACGREIEICLDPGANQNTERFSILLAQSTVPRVPSEVRFSVASPPGSRTLNLSGVLDGMECSDAVICADSFAAHAGPLFEIPTLVAARGGLENWRTPSRHSYYFSVEQPASQTGHAMRVILDASMRQPQPNLPFEIRGTRLDEMTQALTECSGQEPLEERYQTFVESYRDLVETLTDWPAEFTGLLHDADYAHAKLEQVSLGDGDARRHVEQTLARWERTNLRKLLRLSTVAEPSRWPEVSLNS